MLWHKFLWNTYSKSYMVFQLTSWPLILDDLQRSNQGNWVFSGLYLLNRACHNQSLYETHIVSHILYFSWPHYLWPWMIFKGQIKYNCVLNGLFLLNGACYDKFYMKHIEDVIYMYMVFQLTSCYLNWMTFDLGWHLNVKLGTMEVILSNIWIHFSFGKLLTELAHIMTTYDFLSAKQAILSNVWTDFNLTQFHFWSTFLMNWHI